MTDLLLLPTVDKSPIQDNPTPLPCRLTHTLRGHSRSISSVCFSPDGTKLSTSSSDGMVIIWNVILNDQTSGSSSCLVPQMEFLTKLINSDSSEGINDLTWSPDSRYLISASDDHSIYVWFISTNSNYSSSSSHPSPIRRLIGHSHSVYCVKLNPIGTLLISGSFDETIKVWDFLGGKLLRTLPGHSEVVSCLDFSRDGSIIVSGSFDGLIRMWDTTSGQCLKTLVVAQETNAPVSFISFTPNSRFLITGSLDSTVRIWDYRTKEGTVLKSYTGHTNIKYSIPARVISFNVESDPSKETSGEFVLMGSEDGSLWMWHLQSREVFMKLPCHAESIIAISIHPIDTNFFVTAGLDQDTTIKVHKFSAIFFKKKDEM